LQGGDGSSSTDPAATRGDYSISHSGGGEFAGMEKWNGREDIKKSSYYHSEILEGLQSKEEL
jgi:hypothetical protein